MEQHPVPQHISSYQFRLVGDMTVRQFGFLAGGCIIGLIFYATPLAPIIKWPLVALVVFLGFAMAFMPIQERPLDKWIVAFIKAIFSPTQFVWEKQVKEPEIFKTGYKKVVFQKKVAPPPNKKQLREYLSTLPTESQSQLDQQEENFIKKSLNMFQLTKMPTNMAQPTEKIPPIQQPFQPITKPETAFKPKISYPQKTTTPKRRPFVLPKQPAQPRKPTVEAKFSPELPFPQAPTQPNTLVGMVLDLEGKIIENAIIEIRDTQGIPVRALKTNKLGQFRSVTPLDNGQYEIEAEKEGYQFDIIKTNLTGAIVEPLEIRTKGKTHEPAQNT